jgi:hypothetical protein
MRSSSPVIFGIIGLVLAAFWYDAMVASVSAARRTHGVRAATAPTR